MSNLIRNFQERLRNSGSSEAKKVVLIEDKIKNTDVVIQLANLWFGKEREDRINAAAQLYKQLISSGKNPLIVLPCSTHTDHTKQYDKTGKLQPLSIDARNRLIELGIPAKNILENNDIVRLMLAESEILHSSYYTAYNTFDEGRFLYEVIKFAKGLGKNLEVNVVTGRVQLPRTITIYRYLGIEFKHVLVDTKNSQHSRLMEFMLIIVTRLVPKIWDPESIMGRATRKQRMPDWMKSIFI